MKLLQGDREVTVDTRGNWPLIEDLFSSWGYVVNKDAEIEVRSVDKITLELSAWGIPWKRTK